MNPSKSTQTVKDDFDDNGHISCIYGTSIGTSSPLNSVKSRLPKVTVKRRRSRSPNDPENSDSHGKDIRKTALPVLRDIGDVCQIVLTVDREIQPDPTLAYQQLTAEIPKIVKKLKRSGKLKDGRYLWVLEFHQDGFPHLHVLLKKQRNIFNEIDAIYRLGRVFEKNFNNPYDHLGYATKQLCKKTAENLPDWFLDLPSRQAIRSRRSHGFSGIPAKGKPATKTSSKESKKTKTVRQKQAELAAERRGDLRLKILRHNGKMVKLTCSSVEDRAVIERMFETTEISIDRLAGFAPANQLEQILLNQLYHAFAFGYRGKPNEKSMRIIAKATQRLLEFTAIYGAPELERMPDGRLMTC